MPFVTEPSEREQFISAMGRAILDYAEVEKIYAMLLGSLLSIDNQQATVVFHSVPNIRARNEMVQGLLTAQYGDIYQKFWDSCSTYLQKLAKFRNAIAHWHPITTLTILVDPVTGQMFSTDKPPKPGLHNPFPGRGLKSLHKEDLAPFSKDCMYIREELSDLSGVIKSRKMKIVDPLLPLPEKFLKPLRRQNEARLQRSQKPKARQAQPRPSPA